MLRSDDQQPSLDDIRSPAFQRAFDAVPTGLVIVDPSGAIAFVNSAAEGMLLYERNQLMGQPIQALVPAAHRAEYSERASTFLKAPLSSMGRGEDLTALRSDGSGFPAEMILSPLPTSEGNCVLASIIDLTERERLALTAREQHERVQAYWEATSEALITVHASGNIEMVNKATERIFGYDRSELVGRPIETLIPEDHRHAHAEKRDSYFTEPKLRPMGKGLDLSGRRKDGTLFPVDVGLSMARIGDRTVAIAFVSDISERKQLQEQSAALEALVDLQQQLSPVRRRETTAKDSDPLTGLDTPAIFDKAIEKAIADPHGLHAVVYSIQRMDQISARFGAKMADRIVVFASQYIANTLQEESDQLFRWKEATFVSLVRRDSSALQREVTSACGKQLEYFMEHSGGSSLLMIALSVKVLPLTRLSLAEVAEEIEQFILSGN